MELELEIEQYGVTNLEIVTMEGAARTPRTRRT